jgi:hypothetical protein
VSLLDLPLHLLDHHTTLRSVATDTVRRRARTARVGAVGPGPRRRAFPGWPCGPGRDARSEVRGMGHDERRQCTTVASVVVDETRGRYRLEVLPEYRPALQGLGSCTHAIVVWWADRAEVDGDWS